LQCDVCEEAPRRGRTPFSGGLYPHTSTMDVQRAMNGMLEEVKLCGEQSLDCDPGSAQIKLLRRDAHCETRDAGPAAAWDEHAHAWTFLRRSAVQLMREEADRSNYQCLWHEQAHRLESSRNLQDVANVVQSVHHGTLPLCQDEDVQTRRRHITLCLRDYFVLYFGIVHAPREAAIDTDQYEATMAHVFGSEWSEGDNNVRSIVSLSLSRLVEKATSWDEKQFIAFTQSAHRSHCPMTALQLQKLYQDAARRLLAIKTKSSANKRKGSKKSKQQRAMEQELLRLVADDD
jgi:hypothetical protein